MRTVCVARSKATEWTQSLRSRATRADPVSVALSHSGKQRRSTLCSHTCAALSCFEQGRAQATHTLAAVQFRARAKQTTEAATATAAEFPKWNLSLTCCSFCFVILSASLCWWNDEIGSQPKHLLLYVKYWEHLLNGAKTMQPLHGWLET